MEKPNNPQEYNSPGWLFVAISRPGFGAAGVDPPADPWALDIILDRRDLAGGPSRPGWHRGVDGASGAAAGTELSQSSSKSSMSKCSRSKSRSAVAKLFPAGPAVGAVLGALGAVLVSGCFPLLLPGLWSQLLSLSLREAPSLPLPLGKGSSAVPGQGISSALCFDAQVLSKV